MTTRTTAAAARTRAPRVTMSPSMAKTDSFMPAFYAGRRWSRLFVGGVEFPVLRPATVDPRPFHDTALEQGRGERPCMRVAADLLRFGQLRLLHGTPR